MMVGTLEKIVLSSMLTVGLVACGTKEYNTFGDLVFKDAIYFHEAPGTGWNLESNSARLTVVLSASENACDDYKAVNRKNGELLARWFPAISIEARQANARRVSRGVFISEDSVSNVDAPALTRKLKAYIHKNGEADEKLSEDSSITLYYIDPNHLQGKVTGKIESAGQSGSFVARYCNLQE